MQVIDIRPPWRRVVASGRRTFVPLYLKISGFIRKYKYGPLIFVVFAVVLVMVTVVAIQETTRSARLVPTIISRNTFWNSSGGEIDKIVDRELGENDGINLFNTSNSIILSESEEELEKAEMVEATVEPPLEEEIPLEEPPIEIPEVISTGIIEESGEESGSEAGAIPNIEDTGEENQDVFDIPAEEVPAEEIPTEETSGDETSWLGRLVAVFTGRVRAQEEPIPEPTPSEETDQESTAEEGENIEGDPVATTTPADELSSDEILPSATSTPEETTPEAEETEETAPTGQELLPEQPDELAVVGELVVSGFSSSDENTETLASVEKAILNLSLALRGTLTVNHTFQVQYRFNQEETWQNLETFSSPKQYASKRNGNLLSYELDTQEEGLVIDDLKNLEVRLTTLTAEEGVGDLIIYLDALWLDIDYQAADVVKLLSERNGFTFDENPSFSFAGEPASLNIEEIEVLDPKGERLPLKTVIIQERNRWQLELDGEPYRDLLRPGKYVVKIKTRERDAVYAQAIEFYWGVLAINTNKSIYLPGDEAYIQMAALTEEGKTICDANLELEVITPRGAFLTPAIETSGQCGPDSIVDVPDYFAYHLLEELGIYILHLSRLDENGKFITDIVSNFEVRDTMLPEAKKFGDKEVNFIFTDENLDENLIIKTDQETYVGLTEADVYVSVTNTGIESELVNFQLHFPEDKGEIEKIEQWTVNAPEEVDVPEYGSKEYLCEDGWERAAEQTDFEEGQIFYQCSSSNEIMFCESLGGDGKSCTLNDVMIGSHKETRYKDKWSRVKLSKNPLKIKSGFFDRLLGRAIQRKPVPQDFKIKKSTQISGGQSSAGLVEPGETKYFKAKIKFPLDSEGEFYIEAIGDKEGYGLLDPWWDSSWTYRKQITIDHDRVGITSDMSANASSGQDQIIVKDGSLFSASETVVIKDDNNEETGTVSSVSSNTLTMQSNLTNSYTTAANAFVKNTTDSVNLSNFPVLINLASDADLAADAQDDGDDVAFTDNSENQLDHEIENFNGTTGELQAWVEVATLSASSDTVVFMYYGNGACGSQQNTTGTWDSNFRGVWHLDEGGTGTRYDSTSLGHNATATNYDGDEDVSGKISNADDFDGSDDILVGPSSNSITGDNLQTATMSIWVKHSNTGNAGYMTALKRSAADSTLFSLDAGESNAGDLGFLTRNYADTTHPWLNYNGGYNDGQWHHLVAVINNLDRTLYVDGSKRNADTEGMQSVTGNTATFTIGGFAVNNILFDGTVDEVQISNIARGFDWIKTGYNNQNSPSSFYTLEDEETKPDTPILEQNHYHWRNDDGTEATATSATSGTQDTSLTLDINVRKRLRVEISNEGSASSTDIQYRLEYGEKLTTCGAISSWTDVGAVSGDWDMSATDNLTEGNDTTNIAVATGGVTDENTTFETPNSAIKDTSSQTAAISLGTTEFVEAEYSIIAASSAQGKNYCFRLTNAGSTDYYFDYTTYPEASIPKLEQIHYRWRNDNGGEGDATSWYNASWSYRKKITIDHTKVEGDHSSFPVLVHLDSSETDFWSHCSNKNEVVFTQADGTTKLKREVETFNHTTDDLYVWVKIPTMDEDNDLDIYLYYGNGSASETDDIDTWDTNYKMVQHLDDLTTSTTEDSVSSSNNGTKRAANEPIETDGKITKAQSFDGSNDYVKITNNFIVSPTSLTISSWLKKESGGSTYECALHKGSTNTIGSTDYWLGVDNTDYLTATIGANRSGIGWDKGKTTTLATYGEWYYLVASWDGSVVRVYINGDYNKQYALTSYGNLTTPTRFGAADDGTTYQFKGVVDEVRISDTYRDSDWIKTSYNNQSSPSNFYSIGGEQAGAGATWKESEDTVTSLAKDTLARLRFEVSNEGNSTLTSTTYRIEYGVKSTTCAAISVWTALPDDDTQHWRMANSTNLTEGEATTNVDGLTDENTAFVAGQTKDTNNQTTGITLASTQFTEIEYGIKATTNATGGATYCFRVTNASSTAYFTYTQYAQVTLGADPVISISISDGVITYGTMAAGTSKTTVDLTDTQTLTNDGNVTETFNIKGRNAPCPWTLASSVGTDQYVHQFCKATDVSCSSPPTNYTALTTGYQALYTGVAQSGTKQLDLRVIVPTTSSCFTSQSIDVTVQAVEE